jgi:hypothetical protein
VFSHVLMLPCSTQSISYEFTKYSLHHATPAPVVCGEAHVFKYEFSKKGSTATDPMHWRLGL